MTNKFFKKVFLYIKRHKTISFIVLILLIFAGYWAYGAIKGNSGTVSYVTAQAEKGTIVTSVSGSGQVSPSNQLDLKAKASGDVVYVAVKQGQSVKAGQFLVELDDTDAQQSVKNAQINLDNAELTLQNQADFQILNQQDIISTASTITNTMTILLASIAGISLLVGGIGIMNMMLTTVTERTREIGLRKAIGADKRDINLQFLAESFALTFLGGFIGIVLGWLIAFLISKFAGVNTQVSILSIILAFGVSAVIGIIFGYYPARRAARLNPIEALRYE